MVIEIMRQSPLLKKIPVIIVTGSEHNGVDFPPDETYQAVIYKPFDLLEFLDKIVKFL